jgi:hypothetical protein
LFFIAFDLNITTEASRENKGSSKTEPVSFSLEFGWGALDLCVLLKDGILMFEFDPGTVIGNFQDKLVVFYSHFDFNPFFAVEKSVGDKIQEDLTKLCFIL